jgi:hypothetical protein
VHGPLFVDPSAPALDLGRQLCIQSLHRALLAHQRFVLLQRFAHRLVVVVVVVQATPAGQHHRMCTPHLELNFEERNVPSWLPPTLPSLRAATGCRKQPLRWLRRLHAQQR